MIFTFAATSAYDENEVSLTIETVSGESVKIGDTITIPMNDHTFEKREIMGMYRDWKKREKGKEHFIEIRDGEWAECIIRNIHSGKIHTVCSPYDEELSEDGWICGESG